jgi:glyoxylase-like metal-dependent hydrolase (beta-lactamase superfamily II)
MRSLTEIAPGVLVGTSSYALTTTTVVAGSTGSGGCLLIDPAVTVAELAALAASLRALGLPAAVTAAETERDGILTEVRHDAPGHDLSLVGRLRPLDASAIPWDGPEARLIVHDAHAPGHGAVFLPGTGVLVAGDMCSDAEIPLLDVLAADPLGDYRTGLARLAAVPGVRQVIPGHGHVGEAAEFRRRLALDSAYLDAIAGGKPSRDPRLEGCADWLRVTHEEQVRYFWPRPV